MKKLITILVTTAFLVTALAPVAIAGGGYHRYHGHRYHGHHGHHGHYSGDDFWIGLGFGILTAAIVSSIYHSPPPPKRVVYYEPPPVVVSRAPIVIERDKYGKPLKAEYGNVIVTAAELNMRSGPGPDRAIVGTVRKGDVLSVIDSIPSWFYVREPSGRYGWVMDRYTRPAQPLG